MNPRSENWRAAGRVSDLIDYCRLGLFLFKAPGIFLDINQLHLFPELSGFGISIICLLSPKSMSRLTPIEYKLADYLFQVFRTRKHSFATTASSAPAYTGSGSTLSKIASLSDRNVLNWNLPFVKLDSFWFHFVKEYL